MEAFYFYWTNPKNGSRILYPFDSLDAFVAKFDSTTPENRTYTEFLKTDRPRKLYFRYRLAIGQQNPVIDINEGIAKVLKKRWDKEIKSDQIIYSSFKLGDAIINDVVIAPYAVINWREVSYFATQLNEVVPTLQMDYSIYKIKQEVLYPGCYVPSFSDTPDEMPGKRKDLDKIVKTNCILSSLDGCEMLEEMSLKKEYVANPSAGDRIPKQPEIIIPKLEISPSTRKIPIPVPETVPVPKVETKEVPKEKEIPSGKAKKSLKSKLRFLLIGNTRYPLDPKTEKPSKGERIKFTLLGKPYLSPEERVEKASKKPTEKASKAKKEKPACGCGA